MKIDIVLKDKKFLPIRSTKSAAAFDLIADLEEPITIGNRKTELISTGIKIKIPEGFAGLICPRSGNALKKDIIIPNSPGIIDPDYTGEVKVILKNIYKGLHFDKQPIINPFDRIAQLLIVPTIFYTPILIDKVVRVFLENPEARAGIWSEKLAKFIKEEYDITFNIVTTIENTDRGEKGFGSTGE